VVDPEPNLYPMTRIAAQRSFFLLITLTLTRIAPLVAQKNWELKKDEKDIRVYSKTSERSRFNTIKVATVLPVKLGALAALLLDIGNYPQWSFNSRQAYILKKTGPSEVWFYLLIHSPWPASDRDLVVHLRVTQDASTRVMHISEESVPDFIPPKKGLVRVPLSTENWIVTPLPGNHISVDYQLDLDPGASIPAWLINNFSTKGPFETFLHIREQLEQPKYRDATISFIKN
jgi:hypothetical protein